MAHIATSRLGTDVVTDNDRMMNLEHRIPPPVIGLIALVFMYSLAQWLPGFSLPSHKIVALLVFAVGFYFGVSSFMMFRRENTTVNPLKPESASKLVVNGVLQYTRNPMYLSIALSLLAFGVYWQTTALIVVLPLWVGYMVRFQIKPEERAMKKLFGDEFDQYCQRVRRWI